MLSYSEELRLQALKLAVKALPQAVNPVQAVSVAENRIKAAVKFEAYIREGKS